MATKCRRRVIRETSEIHGPTGMPLIIKLLPIAIKKLRNRMPKTKYLKQKNILL